MPRHLDVVMPSKRSSIAPLLRGLEPDLVVCMGFPWKIPPDALAVPRLGWLNGHPSLLPRHRGPIPVAWAIRNGDEEYGITFHRMDAELDTGAILAQRPLPIGELRRARGVLRAHGAGGDGGACARRSTRSPPARRAGRRRRAASTRRFFTRRGRVARSRATAAEVHRLVWAWRFAMSRGELRGALVDLDGETVRVLASSLAEVEGARRSTAPTGRCGS